MGDSGDEETQVSEEAAQGVPTAGKKRFEVKKVG
jgi:hypothetical protein